MVINHPGVLTGFLSHRVVLNASALPDPEVVSYDLLLTYVSCIHT